MNHNGLYDIFTLMNRSFVPKGIFLSRRRNLCRRPGKCDTLGKDLSILRTASRILPVWTRTAFSAYLVSPTLNKDIVRWAEQLS